MRTQFLVQESNKEKRTEFYEYIKKSYDLNNAYPFDREKFIESDFPFVVDFKEKKFWVCESITCCAIASSKGLIFSIDEFKSKV